MTRRDIFLTGAAFFILLAGMAPAGSVYAAAPQDTIEDVKAILAETDEVSRELYQKGLAATRNSDWDQAEVFFQSVLDRHPDFLDAEMRVIAIWLLTQRTEQACARLEILWKKNPEHVGIRDLLVWNYDLLALSTYQAGDKREARSYAERSVRMLPHRWAYQLLGDISHEEGKLREATEYYEHARAMHSSGTICYLLGNLYMHLGDRVRAIARFQESLAYDPPAVVREQCTARIRELSRLGGEPTSVTAPLDVGRQELPVHLPVGYYMLLCYSMACLAFGGHIRLAQ